MTGGDVQEGSDARRRFVWTWIIAGLLAISGAMIAILARHQPFCLDDVAAFTSLRTYSSLPAYVTYWYSHQTGRLPIYIAQWISVAHPAVYAALVGIGFIGLAGLTVATGIARRLRWEWADVLLVGLCAAVYWFGLPSLGEAVFWRSGSANYLWSPLTMLAIAYPYRVWATGRGASRSTSRTSEAAKAGGLLVLGVFAGAWHEQALLSLVVAATILLVWAARSQTLRQVPARLWAGLVGVALGGAVRVLSPSNASHEAYARAAAAHAASNLQVGGPVGQLRLVVQALDALVVSWTPQLLPFLAMLGLLAMLSWSMTRRSPSRRQVGSALAIFAVGVSCLSPVLVVPLSLGARSMTHMTVWFVVAAISLIDLDAIAAAGPAFVSVLSSGVCVLLLVLVAQTRLGNSQVDGIATQLDHRAALVSQAKNAGQQNLIVPPIAAPSAPGAFFTDISTDPNYWDNKDWATLYGVRSIRTSTEATTEP
jgi:hypothetical protein